MRSCRPIGPSVALLPAGTTRFFFAIILLATIGCAQAGSWQWNGNGGSVNWSTGGNWIGGTAPTSNATTDLTFGGTNNTGTSGAPLNQNSGNPFQLYSLTFSSGGGSFFMAGNPFAFTGAGTNQIVQLSSSAESIGNSFTASSNNITLTLTGTGTGTVTLSGVINTGSGQKDYAIVKSGTSTFTLSGANAYRGTTTISGGVLNIQNNSALGAAAGGTSVASGAALQIENNITVVGEALTLNGSGIANDGALRNVSGTNSFTGLITFGSASTISSDAGTLTLSGNVNNGGFLFTESGAGNVTMSGVLSGTGGLTKNGAGTLTLNGAAVNTYTGATTVNQGTLVLATLARSTAGPALTIGGAGSTATVQLGVNYQIYGANTTINSQGQLNLNGFQEYVGTLTLNGGTVVTGTGLLYIGGTGITSNASNVTSTLTGNYSLATASQIFNIASGTTPSGNDVIISGSIGEFNVPTTVTKQGGGKIVLSGANAYTGLTTISAGVLNIQNALALGGGAGTTVSSGAALQIEGNITVTGEALTLNGGGISNDGAFRNISGNNGYTGGITLGSASRINSDAGTLTLSGGVVNGGFTVTFGGASNITESGTISGTGALTKSDGGVLTLGGANSYVGTTTINGGTLAVSSNGNLGNLTSGINLNAGTLEITSGFSTARMITLGNTTSTFQVDASQTFTVSTAITGTGTLNKTGSGTMVLSGVSLFSGGTNVAAGTLQISAVDRLLTTAGVTISGGTFDLQTFGQTTGAVTLASGSITGTGTGTLTGSSYTLQSGSVSAILAGNSTVTKNTSGSVTLSGANTFTGSTTISAGTLQVNTNNALGTAASGTTVASGAVLKLNNVNYATAEPLTLNGSGISNGGALTNTGTSTFAGPINAATNATINAGGGTLNLTGGLSKNGTTLTIAGGGTVNITTNGITGSSPNSDLVVDGTTVNENTANSYNGPTYIRNGGILNANVANALPTANGRSAVILDDSGSGGSQLGLGAPQAVASVTSASSSSISLNGNTLTIGTATGSTTFAGIISGTGGVIKDNASTQIISGPNTFSGSTTVNGGTLIAANGSGSAALGSTSNVTVSSGGIFLLGANDQVNNTATVTLGGGTFAKGNFSEGTAGAPGVGALTLTATGSNLDFGTGAVGVLTFASFTPGSFTLTIDNWTGTLNTQGTSSTDRLIFASDQSANLNSFSFAGYAPGAVEFDLHNGYWEVTPAAVPETSTWVAAALALGVAGCHLLRRRRAPGTVRLRKSPGKFPK